VEGKRRSAVETILKSSAISADASDAESRDVYQEARPRSREDIMLDIRFADGRIVTFSYAYFTRMEYQPGDTLRLWFGGAEVEVKGRRLARLRETLAEHRARSIQEGTEAEEGLKPEDAAHIERIEIQEESEE
jgi:hypothetical protein